MLTLRPVMVARIASRKRLKTEHDEGLHVGMESAWARRCAECREIRFWRFDLAVGE